MAQGLPRKIVVLNCIYLVALTVLFLELSMTENGGVVLFAFITPLTAFGLLYLVAELVMGSWKFLRTRKDHGQ